MTERCITPQEREDLSEECLERADALERSGILGEHGAHVIDNLRRAGIALSSETKAREAAKSWDDAGNGRVRVLAVTYGGMTLYLPASQREELFDHFEDWDYEGVTLRFTTMTQAEFDDLDEFEGF